MPQYPEAKKKIQEQGRAKRISITLWSKENGYPWTTTHDCRYSHLFRPSSKPSYGPKMGVCMDTKHSQQRQGFHLMTASTQKECSAIVSQRNSVLSICANSFGCSTHSSKGAHEQNTPQRAQHHRCVRRHKRLASAYPSSLGNTVYSTRSYLLRGRH